MSTGGSRGEGPASRPVRRLAARALKGYGLRRAGLRPLRVFDQKEVFEVQPSGGETLVLQMYDPSRFREDSLWSVAVWLRHLADAGTAVPKPVRVADGSLLASVSVRDGRRLCVLSSQVPGTPKLRRDLTPDDLRLAGRQMALVHNQAEAFYPPEGFTRPKWGWNWVFGEKAALWETGSSTLSGDEMKVLEEAAEVSREDLGALGTDGGVFGLIHRDLTLSNMLFHERNVHLIDFDRCGWGYYLFDLAVTLSVLGPENRRGLRLRHALLGGYLEERGLPPDYRRHLATFMVLRLAARINWGLEAPADRPDPRQETRFMSNAVRRIRKLLETRAYPA